MSSTRRTCGDGDHVEARPGNARRAGPAAWIAAESKKDHRPQVQGRRTGTARGAAAWNIASAVAMSTSPVTTTVTWSPATSLVAEKGAGPSRSTEPRLHSRQRAARTGALCQDVRLSGRSPASVRPAIGWGHDCSCASSRRGRCLRGGRCRRRSSDPSTSARSAPSSGAARTSRPPRPSRRCASPAGSPPRPPSSPGEHCKPGVTTDEIDRVVHEFLCDHGAYPSTLGYKGFPKSCCTSPQRGDLPRHPRHHGARGRRHHQRRRHGVHRRGARRHRRDVLRR